MPGKKRRRRTHGRVLPGWRYVGAWSQLDARQVKRDLEKISPQVKVRRVAGLYDIYIK